jgi:hypothetical protein
LGLLILPGLNAPLAIGVEFLAIGAKTILADSLPDLAHELKVIGEVVDGVELRP